MSKEVVKTVTHRTVVAEIVHVEYDHQESGEVREFVGVRFKRSLPNGRFSVDFRSADLEDLIDCADKVRPHLVEFERPIKERIAESQDAKWRQRTALRAQDGIPPRRRRSRDDEDNS